MSYQLELRQMRYFLTAAEELHFRRAAERLYISQPGLSKQIKEMETGLGLTLFYRDNRNVKLTAAGSYLKTELAKHLNGLDQTLHHAKMIHKGLKGELKLGYVGSAMQQMIPQLMLRFKQHHGEILFHLYEMDNHVQLEHLLSNQLDMGFVRSERIPRGLHSVKVLNEPFCLVLPIDHPISADNFKEMSQLKNEPFILFDKAYSSSYYEQVMQIFDDDGFTPIVSHSTIHSNSIYKLVEHGFGVSIVPKSLKMDYLQGVKFIDLDNLPQRTTLRAAWNKNNFNPAMTELIQVLGNLQFTE